MFKILAGHWSIRVSTTSSADSISTLTITLSFSEISRCCRYSQTSMVLTWVQGLAPRSLFFHLRNFSYMSNQSIIILSFCEPHLAGCLERHVMIYITFRKIKDLARSIPDLCWNRKNESRTKSTHTQGEAKNRACSSRAQVQKARQYRGRLRRPLFIVCAIPDSSGHV